MHNASNTVINKFLFKQSIALDSIVAFAGNNPEGMELQRHETQLQYVYKVNGKHIFSIFVKFYSEDGYKVNAYSGNGMEKYDFRNIQSYHDAVAILKLIAFKMKSGN